MSVIKKKKPRKKQPSNGLKQATPLSGDPVITSVRAFMRPFNVEKGIAAPLSDGRPSQKFMAKAQTQISLTSGQMFVFMATPNCANNATHASVVFAIGASNGSNFITDGPWRSATIGDQVGAWGTIARISTNTPYTAATLATGYDFSCVGSGLKFTYEGSELYRGGTLRYLYDKDSGYVNNAGDWTADTPTGLVTYINAAANTIRQSINKDNVVEINTSVVNTGYVDPAGNVLSTSYGVNGAVASQLIGGASATTVFSLSPAVLGYYVNTSGNTISFHVDVVEHWALTSPDIQSLQTPSYAHVSLATHVSAVMDNVRQAHATTPNTHHATVATDTLKVMKSPIGHELLNVGLRAALA